MTETVSQFKARVATLAFEFPACRDGQNVFEAMVYEGFGASDEQVLFAEQHRGRSLDPYHDDRRIDDFLAAAVAAGVLMADE